MGLMRGGPQFGAEIVARSRANVLLFIFHSLTLLVNRKGFEIDLPACERDFALQQLTPEGAVLILKESLSANLCLLGESASGNHDILLLAQFRARFNSLRDKCLAGFFSRFSSHQRFRRRTDDS
jgi:hypothetical protein